MRGDAVHGGLFLPVKAPKMAPRPRREISSFSAVSQSRERCDYPISIIGHGLGHVLVKQKHSVGCEPPQPAHGGPGGFSQPSGAL